MKEPQPTSPKQKSRAADQSTDEQPVSIKTAEPTRREKKSEPKAKRDHGRSKTRHQLTTRQGLKEIKQQVPGWVSSLILHVAALFLLAFITLPLTRPPELSLQAVRVVDESFNEDDELLDLDVDLEQDTLEETIDQEFETEPQVEVLTETFETQDTAPLETVADFVDFGAAISDIGDIAAAPGMGSSGLQGRGAASKAGMLASGGGTRSSEDAVQAALDWLARHQYPDGSWNFDFTQSECNGRCDHPGDKYVQARAGATGLALLTYLGAGHTQQDGRYKRVVYNGVYALGNMIKLEKNGASFWDPQGRMYSHGIATMAICEAYAMTGDPALREPAQAAINYVCYAQDPNGGGWRYTPRQAGDTSVVGWQMGALKSGYLSQLSVPPIVVQKAGNFLDLMAYKGGARYHYDIGGADGHEACTAIGALCRMYMGAKKDDGGLKGAMECLSKRGPSKSDVYYNYYTAQTLFHYTGGKGPIWKKWNEKMRDQLVETQSQAGHEAGSWTPQPGAGHGEAAGRLFTTALSTMTLEVYYRMMPIYREKAAGEFD